MYPRPVWDPLPEPPGIDPATLDEFQNLANEFMPDIMGSADEVGVTVARLFGTATDAEADSDSLGLDLAAGALELEAMIYEAAGDTLVKDIENAGGVQDSVDLTTAELAVALGVEPGAPPVVGGPPAPPSF